MGFRRDFVWGAASSAYQTEGHSRLDGGGECIWDAFCRRPGAIADAGDGSIACDAYHRFEEDLDILVCPVVTKGVSRDNWYQTERGIDLVLTEMKHCGTQFGEIFRESAGILPSAGREESLVKYLKNEH